MPPGPEQTRAVLSTIALLNEDGDQKLGRAFVVERQNTEGRLIITAAHCLPSQPVAGSNISRVERTYNSLIAPLGKQATVSAECLFADPVADIAVLGCPDEQESNSAAAEYKTLINSAGSFAIADVENEAMAWILSLDRQWFICNVRHSGAGLWIVKADIRCGMSGSPILNKDGRAIGVLCCSYEGTGISGPHARLACHLPGWMLHSPG
jgi:hypothetical protein